MRAYRYLEHRTTEEKIATQEASIYAYHADGHPITRDSQTELLKLLANMKLSFATSAALPARASILQRATIFFLSGYVEDTLSIEDETARRYLAENLLDLLFVNGLYLMWPHVSLPTAKIVNFLAEFSATQRTAPPPRYKRRASCPTVISFITQLTQIPPIVVLQFLETRISIIKAFLAAGADPMIDVEYTSRDFVSHTKTL